jgi:salicylate hydroxylase
MGGAKMRETEVVVAGGGIGGMTAAVAMAQAGCAVTLLEAAPQFGEIGAGVTLSPNAMKGLDHIGICEAVARAGIEPRRQRIQHWQDGRILRAVDREDQRIKYGAPYVTIHRADLHALLLDAARDAGVRLHNNAPVERSEGNAVLLADGRRFEGDLIVGADGVKSAIRRRFEDIPAHFTGHVAWRALLPVEGDLAPLADYPGIHIGPGRMITRYPVRGGTLLNCVFFARQEGWTEEGWSIPADPEDLARTYAGWCDEVQAMIAAAARGPLFKWAIHARQPLKDWIVDDRVTLLGDAAHAMTPFLGHGAACAIEDAVVLSRAIEQSETVAEALRRYVAARHERTSFIQAESNANADRMQGQETESFGLAGMRDEESLGLFTYDCRTVAL